MKRLVFLLFLFSMVSWSKPSSNCVFEFRSGEKVALGDKLDSALLKKYKHKMEKMGGDSLLEVEVGVLFFRGMGLQECSMYYKDGRLKQVISSQLVKMIDIDILEQLVRFTQSLDGEEKIDDEGYIVGKSRCCGWRVVWRMSADIFGIGFFL